MIANLPSPIQYDDADDIAAARKAYDALSEAQKAAVENYDKLTAAEAAWNQCDRWGQVSAREFAPTSDGISYAITYQSYSTQKSVHPGGNRCDAEGPDRSSGERPDRSTGPVPARITYTIPASYTGDTVNIFAADAVNDAMNIIKYLPGDAKAMQIEVINLSAHSYTYAEGSFSVSTEVYQTYYDLKMADSSGIPAFDKQTIPVQYLAHRTSNSAIEALLRKSTAAIFSTEVTDEALGEKLLALKDSSGNSLYPNGFKI
jgi:hypothetical protein